MKVYISGPITGTDDYMERFKAVEILLRANGHDPVNPASENADMPKNTRWATYMGKSLRLLCECDAIYMMRNSMRSRGAMVEYGVATAMDKEVMMEVVYNEANYAG